MANQWRKKGKPKKEMYPGFSEYHFGRCRFPNINTWNRLRETSLFYHFNGVTFDLTLFISFFFQDGNVDATLQQLEPLYRIDTANVINEYFIMSGCTIFCVYLSQQICTLPFSLKMNLFHFFSQHFFCCSISLFC